MTAQGGASADQPDRRSYAALRYPASRMYLMFAAMAMMADHIEHVITYWMIYAEFRSPSLAGFAVIAHWVPFLLGSIWAGALADRYDPRRIIQISMVLFMAVSLAWGGLFLPNSLEKWHAVVLLIVHGCAGALWAPAAQILIHAIVGTPQLQSGIRLMATSLTLGMALGPAVGGALLLTFGPSRAVMINAAIYLPLLIWLINKPEKLPTSRTPSANRMTSFADMFAALRQISAIPIVFAMTLLGGLAAALVGNGFQPHLPQFARDFGFGVDGLRYTLLLGAYATGALSAGIILESRAYLPSNARTAFVLAILWAVAMLGFAVATSYQLALALLLAAGFLDLAFNSMARALAQLHAAPELRGRAIGLYNVGALGCRTFSGFTIGFGAGIAGIHWSLALSAAALVTALMVLFAWTARTGAAAARG
ncbi:MAG: MFS transporter [Rhizobiales bacterium]|nr:MFS transporter [Hyphomicrobiales bacterium]